MRYRRGTTIVELLIAIGLVGLLVALGLPAVQMSREKSRAFLCRNRLRSLAIASQNHQSTHGVFPRGGDMVNDGTNGGWPRSHSPHVYLLPFLDEVTTFRRIDIRTPAERELRIVDVDGDPNGEVKKLKLPIFVCPSDGGPNGVGRNNYRGNIGISSAPHSFWQSSSADHGAFFPPQRACSPTDFPDGLSQTVAFSERVAGDGAHRTYSPSRDWWYAAYRMNGLDLGQMTSSEIDRWFLINCGQLRDPTPPHASDMGMYWIYAGLMDTWYNHALTPNSPTPDCGVPDGIMSAGLVTARSQHSGGVHITFMDGSARFVSNFTDIRVWQAWGTRDGYEISFGE